MAVLREVPKWDEWFLQIAESTSKRSKHPTTQVGCVIVHPDSYAQVTSGYNGMLAKLQETIEMWLDDNPLTRTVHAEKNAIAFAARYRGGTDGCTAYITHFPCWECTTLLIAAGIRRIVTCRNNIAIGHMNEVDQVLSTLRELNIPIEYELEVNP